MKILLVTTLTALVCLMSLSACKRADEWTITSTGGDIQPKFQEPFTAGIKWKINNEEKQCQNVLELLSNENFQTKVSVSFSSKNLIHQCEISAESNNLITHNEFLPIIEKMKKINPKAEVTVSYKLSNISKNKFIFSF